MVARHCSLLTQRVHFILATTDCAPAINTANVDRIHSDSSSAVVERLLWDAIVDSFAHGMTYSVITMGVSSRSIVLRIRPGQETIRVVMFRDLLLPHEIDEALLLL